MQASHSIQPNNCSEIQGLVYRDMFVSSNEAKELIYRVCNDCKITTTATTIAKSLQNDTPVRLIGIGITAVYNAVKSIILAADFARKNGSGRIVFNLSYKTVEVALDQEKTSFEFAVRTSSEQDEDKLKSLSIKEEYLSRVGKDSEVARAATAVVKNVKDNIPVKLTCVGVESVYKAIKILASAAKYAFDNNQGALICDVGHETILNHLNVPKAAFRFNVWSI